MNLKHSLLVDPLNSNQMDCMGRTVAMKDFCLSQKKIFDRPFLRGYINTKMKEAVCETGSALKLSLECLDKNKKWCNGLALTNCKKLTAYYAHDLQVRHGSYLGKKLNCYWAVESKSDFL